MTGFVLQDNTSIDALKATKLRMRLRPKVGFLVMEPIDFGSARKINAIYQCLLKITPFSKSETVQFDNMLRDQNLIVHHGSVFTTKYLEQSKAGGQSIEDVFWNSLVVDESRVAEAIGFIWGIAKKISEASYKAPQGPLTETAQMLDPERQKALDYFVWLGDEDESNADDPDEG